MRREKGIKIQTYIIWIFSATVLSSILLLTGIVRLQKQYDKNVEIEIQYHTQLENAETLVDGFNYLTKQVQHFAVTGDEEYLHSYFQKAGSGNREKLIEYLEKGELQNNDLRKEAEDASNELMKMEYHSMKLIVQAEQTKENNIPEEILEYRLSEEELLLSGEEMIIAAQKLVFGEEYQKKKDKIDNLIMEFTKDKIKDNQHQSSQVRKTMRTLMIQQLMFAILLILIVAVAFIIWYTQVVVILQKYIKNLTQDKPLEGQGVFEFRYLADTYNEVSKKNSTETEILQKRAEYDALTGIINRGTFEYRLMKIMQWQKIEEKYIGAFLLIDIDHFKNVNDKYGHETGDRLLKKLANLLKTTFRTTDLVCRFGGDEFAVWMYGLSKSQQTLITAKVDLINQILLHPEEDLPSGSISVGAAFLEEEDDFTSIYKKADEMLYQVKRNGRCGCAIYKKEENR